jgi:hypothetical protein
MGFCGTFGTAGKDAFGPLEAARGWYLSSSLPPQLTMEAESTTTASEE